MHTRVCTYHLVSTLQLGDQKLKFSSSSYAITLAGAYKALYQIGGFNPVDRGIDHSFIKLLKSGHLRGWTLTPPPITKWERKGAARTDNYYGPVKEEEEPGVDTSMKGGDSVGLLNSARVAMEGRFDGEVRFWGQGRRAAGGGEGRGKGNGIGEVKKEG